jgi:hypothetical protein
VNVHVNVTYMVIVYSEKVRHLEWGVNVYVNVT